VVPGIGKPFPAGAGQRLPLRLTTTRSLPRRIGAPHPTRPVNPPGAQPSRTGGSVPQVQGELAVDTPLILDMELGDRAFPSRSVTIPAVVTARVLAKRQVLESCLSVAIAVPFGMLGCTGSRRASRILGGSRRFAGSSYSSSCTRSCTGLSCRGVQAAARPFDGIDSSH
jgi:hypothetical protein